MWLLLCDSSELSEMFGSGQFPLLLFLPWVIPCHLHIWEAAPPVPHIGRGGFAAFFARTPIHKPIYCRRALGKTGRLWKEGTGCAEAKIHPVHSKNTQPCGPRALHRLGKHCPRKGTMQVEKVAWDDDCQLNKKI